jgi:hemolysin-activating ACP:hemolysin acyltransferase
MRSDQLKRMALEDLEHVVVPAVATGQFLVAEAQSAANGLTAPVGVVLWATVSDAVDQRLSSALERPLRLAKSEWTSGENAWLVVAAGEARVVSGMLKRLQTTILKGRPLKAVSRDKSGQPSLKVWPAA